MSAALVRVMAAMGCLPKWDSRARARYCEQHGAGWLSDVDACVYAERVTLAALGTDLPAPPPPGPGVFSGLDTEPLLSPANYARRRLRAVPDAD